MRSRSRRFEDTRHLNFEQLEHRWLLTNWLELYTAFLADGPNTTVDDESSWESVAEQAGHSTWRELKSQHGPTVQAEGEASDVPVLIAPLEGDVVESQSVTLQFEPLPGYSGNYLVRLDDVSGDNRQAPGFQHDCNVHYLCVFTNSTRITVPVEPGEDYNWWVHKPGSAAAGARFSVAEGDPPPPPPPSPDIPVMIRPLDGDVIDAASVTLEFEPLPGYSGNYLVRLDDLNWDGTQAAGFQHDCNVHYLCLATRSTQITVPVESGEDYNWWVHKSGSEAARAGFSVAERDPPPPPPPPPPSPDIPVMIRPLDGDVIDAASVTLEFEPLPGYSGKYLVRLDDLNWDGTQAAGFQHDCNVHYLCLATRSTQITVPVESGEDYNWWVHKSGSEAARAGFSVAERDPPPPPPPPPSPDIPVMIGPLDGDVIDAASVTLEFEPLPGYSGKYFVRLDDLNWDGTQAAGFQHDCNVHYLCLATRSTQITVPVESGEDYNWWVHKSGSEAARAGFSVAERDPPPPPPPPPPSPDIPVMIRPLDGDVVEAASVTLEFEPLPGYSGNYLARLDDLNWDGTQAAGFQHDCNVHYLCLATRSTRITVPAELGETYNWWVHKPGYPAAIAMFRTDFGAPVLVDGRYRCVSMEPLSGEDIDASMLLQHCIDQVPVDATLEVPIGEYRMDRQLVINRRIVLTSVGKSLEDPVCSTDTVDCAAFTASPEFNDPNGLLVVSNIETLHHIVVNGNKQGRQNTAAFEQCDNANNRYGFVAVLECDDCQVVGSVFQNAICGTGLEVSQTRSNVVIHNNTFANNGTHDRSGLWADGLTVHDLSNGQITDNEFIDNTDIDLILGGCQDCVIQNNTIVHSADVSQGAFAALMIHKWPGTSGNYSGTTVSSNVVDCGPNRSCGSGIYLASEGWYNETPFGRTSGNPSRASIHDNVVRNVKNGMYVAARGFSVFNNQYENAHGISFRATCGNLHTDAPIVVSPTATDIDFHNENVDPLTRDLFESQSWIGCIPNWP